MVGKGREGQGVRSLVLLAVMVTIVVTGCSATPPSETRKPTSLPSTSPTPTPTPIPLCEQPAVLEALAGTDAELIAAVGGADAFREAVASGAQCLDLSDPNRHWVLVNKQRALVPLDFEPGDLAWPSIRNINGTPLRAGAVAALEQLVAAALAEGVGEIGMLSGYRSYATQDSLYAWHVWDKGQERADLVSARPGHSEHQTGLTADLVPCFASGCLTIDDFGASAQGKWAAANAWRFGFITRYEAGRTEVTGYTPEPWHMRFVGVELAAAYHDGAFTTLEEFLGQPPARTY
ncbi:M15 family metallopeptidase [Cryobacterium sp. BB307]|uniref:M15 family metallopeptidase n=1 Tax=Cryobacterium sp. BB307 TaxID=2716317 RepID=UPI001444D5EE|nr:M15 family metallopeptidase [Cryobacterium sp. BB307]